MAGPVDPSKLLDRVLKLIDQDTKRIRKLTLRESKSLNKDTAATLCKYATTVSAIKADKKEAELEQKRKLERLSTDELIELHKKQTRSKP